MESKGDRQLDLIRWVASQHRGVRRLFDINVGNLVTPEQMKQRPHGMNSIVWTMWHLARTEDVVVNGLIRLSEQVLHGGGWGTRLGAADERIGTTFSDEEVEHFTNALDPAAVGEYWQAVADETSSWIKASAAEELDRIPDIEGAMARVTPLTTSADDGLMALWGARKVGTILGIAVITHGYVHVGEMTATRGILGVLGGL